MTMATPHRILVNEHPHVGSRNSRWMIPDGWDAPPELPWLRACSGRYSPSCCSSSPTSPLSQLSLRCLTSDHVSYEKNLRDGMWDISFEHDLQIKDILQHLTTLQHLFLMQYTVRHMVVSKVVPIFIGVPPTQSSIFLDGISLNINHPAMGYPHDYGNPY